MHLFRLQNNGFVFNILNQIAFQMAVIEFGQFQDEYPMNSIFNIQYRNNALITCESMWTIPFAMNN